MGNFKWTPLLNAVILLLNIASIIFAQSSSSAESTTTTTSSLPSSLISSSYEPEEHKALFPLTNSDYWGMISISLGLMIAASGGIGGGGIVVPLLILVLGFQPKHAVALSNFTILGSSLTNMVLNVMKTHPTADRPLVDWDLILVMEPLTMAGAVCYFTLSSTQDEEILRLLYYCIALSCR
jgi:hypothetical protein